MQEDNITGENLDRQIGKATSQLLEMAKECSWNNISGNVTYVLRKIEPGATDGENLHDRNRIRKKVLEQQAPVSLGAAADRLKSGFENIYLLDLYIFKANKKETIVEIEILEKTELDPAYQQAVNHLPPRIHCKVAIPPYSSFEAKDKFDINWQLETVEYQWKMFRRRWKTKK